ncbi:hypothetical protein IF188_14005 [Microbacterium sp. NEAU-LLC]|uniref:Uncharacterized protein n=1 Tax=Microbacterium helvum TaxID=2773713 RepID=A0ABR8NQ97_9MICO|nr:hypothetical protein [Microbacterium helvum]MBD3942810.1 hypothetical protein [Microbacterium helvum]
MAENYLFEFYGARFNVTIELGGTTTTDPPNLRVIEGTWKTWRLTIDPDVSGLDGLTIQRSVSAGGGEHPHGNLTEAESAPTGYQVMSAPDGSLYRIPDGFGAVARMYTASEWAQQLAEWEADLEPMSNEIRPVDRARASQLVTAQVTGDREMFAVAVQATLDDDYGLGELGSLINVLRVLSEDLAGILVDTHGDNAAPLMRSLLASQLAEES